VSPGCHDGNHHQEALRHHAARWCGSQPQTAGLRLLREDGPRIGQGAVSPEADGLLGLVRRVEIYSVPVRAAIESMNGARGYTGLCPRVYQSGERDHRGSLAEPGPCYVRWVLIEVATHAARSGVYRERYQRTATRLGRQRGEKIGRVEMACELTGRSGTCSRATNPSLRQAPRCLWPYDGPSLRCTSGGGL